MIRFRKFFFVIIFLTLLISTIYVINNPRAINDIPQTENQSQVSGIELDKLIKQTIKNTGNIETYYQNTELIYEYSEMRESVSSRKSLNMVMTAKVDVSNKTLWTAINSTLDESDKPVNVEVEMYSTGDDLYIDIKTYGESPGWFRSKQIITSWNKLVSFENVLKVMEEENVFNSRNEILEGKDFYVLEIPVKDTNIIYRILKNSYGLENQFRYTFELFQAFSDYFVLEIWIEIDSLNIVKTVVSMNVVVTPERVTGMKADTATYSLQMTTNTYNINQSLAIELPEELHDAPMIHTINE